MALPKHGANPHTLYERLGILQPPFIIDFSENCNPEGPPSIVSENWNQLYSSVARYPDPTGEPFLSAIAAYHGITTNHILLGNGAAEILTLLAANYQHKHAILIDPTFSEYEATLEAAGAYITKIQAQEENGFSLPFSAIRDAISDADVLYLCTPNNPTGLLPKKAELLELIQYAKKAQCDIILDEAFIDWVGEKYSLSSYAAEHLHVTVVRSMTKMYAIPGIRLGYAIAHPTRIAELKHRAPHWNVNAIAAQIGTLCLSQQDYRIRAIDSAAEERRKMIAFLEAHHCTVIPSVTNYIVFRPPKEKSAIQLFHQLLTYGLVVRHTENFKGLDGRWLRIGMKTSSEMEKLRNAIHSCLNAGQLTFICGGVRSGKSAYAEKSLIKKASYANGRLIYIASGSSTDSEMANRIARHQQERLSEGWETVEQQVNLENVLPKLQKDDYVLWDCATTWLANEAFAMKEDEAFCLDMPGCIEQKISRVLVTIDLILLKARELVIVSNEVFDESLSDEKLTREYTKALGILHQRLVERAQMAIEMDSGMAIVHKGGE